MNSTTSRDTRLRRVLLGMEKVLGSALRSLEVLISKLVSCWLASTARSRPVAALMEGPLEHTIPYA
jgi:hypothetical protein